MKPKLEDHEGLSAWGAAALLLVGLVAGILIEGVLESGALRLRELNDSSSRAIELEPFLKLDSSEASGSQVPNNGLKNLWIEFDEEAARKLQRVREDALNRGLIIQSDEDMIQGTVRLGATDGAADLRIKGDWTDHVETDKWSLRIKLKDAKLGGMSVFSIQHPKTRGMLWEWLVLKAARREKLLAPRSTFVNVMLNENSMGVYYLEEHFSKELLESQGRREGPIVIWDESTLWASMLQAHNLTRKGISLTIPLSAIRTWAPNVAEIRAYDEKRLKSSDALQKSLFGGVEQMALLQARTMSQSRLEGDMTRWAAKARLAGASVTSLVDIESLSRMHALATLFQLKHAFAWHNLRFYHDPVLDRLEPILFDCNAQSPSGREVIVFRPVDEASTFKDCDDYVNGVFRQLGSFCEPEYLDALFKSVEAELTLFEKALNAESPMVAKFSISAMFARLRTEQSYLKGVIDPPDPLNLQAVRVHEEERETEGDSDRIDVYMWADSDTPIVVTSLQFGEGREHTARSLLASDENRIQLAASGEVILSNNRRIVRFSIPLTSERMGETTMVETRAVSVTAHYRPIALAQQRTKSCSIRPSESGIRALSSPSPSLESALRQHSFLEFVHEDQLLRVRPGTWKVSGDLRVPDGFALHASGARLRFEGDSGLYSNSPLHFRYVTLQPQNGIEHWRGVVVDGARVRSSWDQVFVHSTHPGPSRDGGVTFNLSPITMSGCRFDSSRADAALVIVDSDFRLKATQILRSEADAMRTIRASGRLLTCTLQDAGARGLHAAGSSLELTGCELIQLGTTAITSSRGSQLRVVGGLVEDATVGLLSTENSRLDAEGTALSKVRDYALATFNRTAGSPPAKLHANDLVIGESVAGRNLAHPECALKVNGTELPHSGAELVRAFGDWLESE